MINDFFMNYRWAIVALPSVADTNVAVMVKVEEFDGNSVRRKHHRWGTVIPELNFKVRGGEAVRVLRDCNRGAAGENVVGVQVTRPAGAGDDDRYRLGYGACDTNVARGVASHGVNLHWDVVRIPKANHGINALSVGRSGERSDGRGASKGGRVDSHTRTTTAAYGAPGTGREARAWRATDQGVVGRVTGGRIN
jgi:hypothetical protein